MLKRKLLLAALLAVIALPAGAFANPCSGTNVVNCINGNDGKINSPSQNQNQIQGQQQSNDSHNKAYGGAGGNASSSATGGAANASQNQSQSSTSEANNAGNNQSTVFNDRLQAPAVSSFIAASGPCTGVSGGGAVSVAGFGLGASFASLEEDCKKRELLRIGFASGNAAIQAQAAQGWQQMFQDQFGSKNMGGNQQASAASNAGVPENFGQTGEVTAETDTTPRCSNDNWPLVMKMARHCF